MAHVWEVSPGLFQADMIGAVDTKADCVVTCSPLSELPAVLGDLLNARPLHVLFPFLDCQSLPDMYSARAVAQLVMTELYGSAKCLIHCNMGQNRSGLMCGLIMQAMGQKNVVAAIQKVHPQALNNPVFAAALNDAEVFG